MINEILSGVLGAILGAGVSFLTLRYNYRDLYARSISTSRMEWINNFREEISIIVATVRTFSDKKNNEKNDDNFNMRILEAEKARAKLLLRLNLDTSKPGNEYNRVMLEVLSDFDFRNPSPNDEQKVKILIDLTRKILEPEWKKVKREAEGGK